MWICSLVLGPGFRGGESAKSGFTTLIELFPLGNEVESSGWQRDEGVIEGEPEGLGVRG
jgi:hypothetical protein